jgi:uncharacterized iron-regulated membrane protein
MRQFWVKIHRYAGLTSALFLTVAALTGSLLAFGADLDAWLNPKLFQSSTRGKPLSFDTLVQRIEASDCRIQVDYLSAPAKEGTSAFAFVSPKADPACTAPQLTYDQIFIDPVGEQVLGSRKRGACCLEPENLYYFVLHMHHSLFLPGMWGWWFMGGIAILWLLDSFIGLYLTFPVKGPLWKKWWAAWRIKAGSGAYRLNFDIHRAGSLWLWTLLIVMALSSVALNLKREVFLPTVSFFSPLTLSPFDLPRPTTDRKPVISFEEARQLADRYAEAQGWSTRTSGITLVRSTGVYLALLWPSHSDRGTGMGEPWLYFDAYTGQLLGEQVPGNGTAGDVFAQVQFPLHSGQVAGLAGRIAVAALGVAIAAIAITGVVIWLKKRRSRVISKHRKGHA